jgi:hypothetical protein
MNDTAEMQRTKENLVAIDPTIANSELAYEYHAAVCDSIGVSAMSIARFEEVWKDRCREAAGRIQQQPTTTSAEKLSVSMQRRDSYTFVDIVSGGRDLTVRTLDGTADELRAIAKEMRFDAMMHIRRAALVQVAAEQLDRANAVKKAA